MKLSRVNKNLISLPRMNDLLQEREEAKETKRVIMSGFKSFQISQTILLLIEPHR